MGYYVDKSKLSRNLELRDHLILTELTRRIEAYEKKFILLGQKANKYTARELADYVDAKSGMDFLVFFGEYVKKMNYKKSTAASYTTCYNHLKRFKTKISLSGIDTDFLNSFLLHLQKSGTGKRGQQLCLTLLKAVFRQAQKKNRKETGIFVDDPFDDFTIPESTLPKKRNIPVKKIRELVGISDISPSASLQGMFL